MMMMMMMVIDTMTRQVSTRWPWVTLLAIAGNLAYLGTAMHVSGSLLPPFVESADERQCDTTDDHFDDDFDEGH